MFQVNDVIVYGSAGVCRITAMEEKSISGSRKTYFVLKPIHDPTATIFAPTDNAHVLQKMRRLLPKAEIDRLIDAMPEEDITWVANESERKELFKGILSGGDHLELIKMIKAIYAHREAREAEGKRLHMSDEHFFKDAEQILYKEFQYVLELNSKEDLMQYILSRIGNRDPYFKQM